MVADLSFPVLGLSGPTLYVHREAADLLTCGEIALKNGYFSRLRLIDSAMCEYRVLDASQVAYAGLFGGWRPFYASRKVRVDLTLGPARKISLSEVLESVVATMNLARDFWEESTGDLDEAAAEIRALQSFDDLIQRFDH